MKKVKFKVNFKSGEKSEDQIKLAINEKVSDKIIEYQTVPRIGEWIDLLELSENYNLSEEELKWLSSNEHKFRIENVHIRENYFEADLDIDKIWPEEPK